MKRCIPIFCLLLLCWGCSGNHGAAPRPDDSVEKEALAMPPSTSHSAMKKRIAPDEEVRGRSLHTKASGPQAASGLKAAYADDNLQFNRFLAFLETHRDAAHIPTDVSERITLTALDSDGLTLPDCRVEISLGGDVVDRGVTTADGIFRTFPSLYAGSAKTLSATFRYGRIEKTIALTRNGKRDVEVTLKTPRTLPDAVPLDLLFILDTTGSMGEEIDRLKTSIDLINLNLSQLPAKPLIRYGMVLYRDKGDAYVTEVIPFTHSLETFRNQLAGVRAGGGGDTPEDLESALDKGINELEWGKQGVRLAFAITDAPPHLDYDHTTSYIDAARAARQKGIKIFTVGTGGLSIDGEYVLRQISQLTGGAYIFLTYGERTESDGGEPGSVSHHTGSNFTSDKLEAVIINITRHELSHLMPQANGTETDYFQGVSGTEAPEKVTAELFEQAVEQLADYAAISLAGKPATAILPLASKHLGTDAEYLSTGLLIAATRNPMFTVVERGNTPALINEIKLGLSGLMDESTAAEAGRLTGASLLIAGRINHVGHQVDVVIRLIRVETGEVISATRILMDEGLLPSKWK